MSILEDMACAIYGPHATKRMVQDAGEWLNCLCAARATLSVLESAGPDLLARLRSSGRLDHEADDAKTWSVVVNAIVESQA